MCRWQVLQEAELWSWLQGGDKAAHSGRMEAASGQSDCGAQPWLPPESPQEVVKGHPQMQ